MVNESVSPSIDQKLRNGLSAQSKVDRSTGIRAKFVKQADRVDRFSFDIDGLYIDLSKSHISDESVALYKAFAEDIGFSQQRHNFFSGAKINATEDRSVLHTLLRDPSNQGIVTKNSKLMAQAEASYQGFIQQYEKIQAQIALRKNPVKNIIHVGIGGSSLGTQLIFEALKDVNTEIEIHFVGNIDAHELVSVLAKCDVGNTLVIGVSKTFSTAETLQNIRSIGEWSALNGGEHYLDSVFAVTANADAAEKFGIAADNIVTFPDWVGGRYSLWSSVSLSAALVLGIEKFQELLEGAADLDRYFYTTPVEQNACFLTAMMDHYYANFFEVRSRAVFAYEHRLRFLVNYLQQLETESNGKDRQRNGEPVDQQTAQVVWGGVGTDAQHSVFQMLHQGSALIPAEFLLVMKPDHALHDRHTELLANGVAQAAALLAGQNLSDVNKLYVDEGLSELTAAAKVFSGDRPSTTIILESLSPHRLGALLAFYEHRTFCGGVLANINSFDQMGVELGKRLAQEVKPMLKHANSSIAADFDASTLELIRRLNDRL